MAKLTKEQIKRLELEAEQGSSLNDLQKLICDEFKTAITYMETRFLLMDLGIKIKDKIKNEASIPDFSNPQPPTQYQNNIENQDAPQPDSDSTTTTSELKLTVDSLTIPGTLISGKVIFSDGSQAGWAIDDMGRMGLRDVPPGFKPPSKDIPAFQQQLQIVLAKLGI
jgi:hypothetical protein